QNRQEQHCGSDENSDEPARRLAGPVQAHRARRPFAKRVDVALMTRHLTLAPARRGDLAWFSAS
ncbi:MAG TPA: hypothetical protein VLD86_01635, partial [Ilumatobacteraceae bacterium]|nr:hypothetical protein [Ilumatobacteraceae bacterium]